MTLFDEPDNPDNIYQINQRLMGVTLPGVLHENIYNYVGVNEKSYC